ncbi:MAG: erythromycin esterase family protein [Herminiimonas sp.]|nr:erythromycin esterase family protein [Herminiimonas sp.]
MSDATTIEALREDAHPFILNQHCEQLLKEIGDASIVLLGEATHGTQEFYRARAEISQRLITEKGFDAIAVEADWPDALRVSRYIQHASKDLTSADALAGFERFPQWMWRNTEVVALVDWLREHNEKIVRPQWKVGFFGLDLYSLRSSMDAVIRYLEKVDPEAARRARARYGCFDHLAEDPQHYGYAATFGMKKDCEEEVIRQLVALTSDTAGYLKHEGRDALDELFYAQQNARVAKSAEAYYRSMFRGRDESWNLRDTHMADTLDALRRHITDRKGSRAKLVVWAHNSHIGDARATEMGAHGQLNLGQLVRERYDPDESYLVGFTTHDGTVTAASEWDAPPELKKVNPSRQDSFERLFHDTGLGDFMLPIRGRITVPDPLSEQKLERAIGVIYLPDSERVSHYFHADMSRQFDAVIHIDRTTAVRPLDHSVHWKHEEVPETYPFGL